MDQTPECCSNKDSAPLKRHRQVDNNDGDDDSMGPTISSKRIRGQSDTEVSASAIIPTEHVSEQPISKAMLIDAMRTGVKEGVVAAMNIIKPSETHTAQATAPLGEPATTVISPVSSQHQVDASRTRASAKRESLKRSINLLVESIIGD